MIKTILFSLLLSVGSLAHAQGEKGRAEIAHAQEALAEALAHHGPDDAGVLEPLDRLIERHYFYYVTEGVEPLILQALSIRESTLGPDHPDTLTTQHSLGLLYWDTAQLEEAETAFRDAFDGRLRTLGSGDLKTTNSAIYWASALLSLGRLSDAEMIASKAHQMRADSLGPGHIKTIDALGTLAATYAMQGRYEDAEAALLQSLPVYEREYGTDHRDRAATLDDLASIYTLQEKFDRALPLRLEALEINLRVRKEDHFATLGSRNSLAFLYYRMGRFDEAERGYLNVLEARTRTLRDDHPDTLTTVNDLAVLYLDQGLFDQARPLFERALSGRILRLGDSHPDTAESFWGLGRLARMRGDRPNEAIYFHKRAVNVLQEQRQDLARSGPDAQAAFSAKWRQIYLDLQQLFVAKGLFSSAELVGRMVKQAEFSNFVRGTVPVADGGMLALDSRERNWNAQLDAMLERPNQLAQQIEALRKKRDSETALSESEVQQLADLEKASGENYALFRADVNAWLIDVRAIESEQLQEEARSLELASSERMQEIMLDIGTNVALLQIVAFEESTHLFLITPSAFKHVEAPVGRTELFNAIFDARQLIDQGRDLELVNDPLHLEQLHASLGELFGWLIAPVKLELSDAGTRTLMINAQGEIRYVPFAALWDGNAWLTERYELAIYTPAAQTQFQPPNTVDRGAAFGLSNAAEGFSPLPAVREELRLIVGDETQEGVIEGTAALNEQFSLAALESALTNPAPILHIASHFAIRPGNEADSFLVLGDGTRLSVAEISRSARLRFRGIELLTLSACDTAIRGNGAGLEFEGLGVLAQNKGAASVLASLWSVADDTTPQFMRDFYVGVANDQLSKAAALQAAQLAMIRSDEASHPFFWAPFVLMGNWR